MAASRVSAHGPGGGTSEASHARPASVWREARTLAGLKWRLLRNTLARSTWVLVGTILGGLYVLFLVTMAVIGLVALGAEAPSTIATVAVLCGALLMLAWWLIPVVATKADDSLNPSKLALFPLRIPGLQLGQLLGALVGIPGAATALVLLGWIASWRYSPAAIVAAVVCALLGLGLALSGSRCVSALTADLGRHRRAGELISVALLGLLVLLGPIISLFARGLENVWDRLPAWAATLAWTPLGAVWAIPADVAHGAWGPALARLAITLASLAILCWVWGIALRRALSSAAATSGRGRSRSVRGIGWFGRLPATQWGAVTARCLTYWLKDPRYSASLVIIPAIAVALWFTSSGGVGMILVLPVFVALLMAYSISADVSYDNTAFSLHVLAPVSGRADRLGRALAMCAVALPLIAGSLVVSTVRTGAVWLVPGLAGISLGVLFSGAGVVSILSARYTYPVPPPGASPWKTPQGYTALNVVLQFVIFALVALTALPATVLTVVGAVTSAGWWGWLALAVGLVQGIVLLSVGVIVGGRWLDRRGPELLQEVAAYR